MKDFNYWLWLVKTDKVEFFVGASGEWTEAEAAQKVLQVFKMLNIDIVGMIPRKRITPGADDRSATIIQQLEPKEGLGFDFLAGKELWKICGRLAEYEAELIVHEKQMEDYLKNGTKRV